MTWFVTDFADQAVVLPLAACVALVLAALGRARDACAWTLAVGATLGITLLLKVATRDCAWAIAGLGAENPSGHTAAAAVVYGGLVALVTRRRLTAIPAAAGIAALIGATRIMLGKHTGADVEVGAIVGVLGAVLLATALRPGAPVKTRIRMPLIIATAVVLLIFHGRRLAAEGMIAEGATHVWPFSQCVADAR